MLHFCTLFNSAYLTRGLVMYDSLIEHCKSFHLYIFAFDDACADALHQMSLPHLTVIRLSEFEDEDLLRIKSTRTAGEYCWTSTPSTILYCIENFKLDHCTYIDADMMFYSDPIVLIEEMGQNSILLTKHNYTRAYDQSMMSGTYCVQFMCFKNDDRGMKALRWWRNACIDWCFARVEDGKFGDQMYLEDWTTRFEGVHVLTHMGGGLAPWNIQQFEIAEPQRLLHKGMSQNFTPVFFHFHGLRFHNQKWVELTGAIYQLSPGAIQYYYKPYVRKLVDTHTKLRKEYGITFDPNGNSSNTPNLGLTESLKRSIVNLRIQLNRIRSSNPDIPLVYNHTQGIDEFLKVE